jgi:hypothetical protein
MHRPIPLLALVFIGIATGLLWMGLVLGLFAMAIGGAAPILSELQAGISIGPARLIQYGTIAFGYMVLLILGTWILIARFSSGAARAGAVAVILVRMMMVVSVLNLFASSAIIWSVGGFLSALPGVLGTLPMTLVTLATLICADAYFRHSPEDVFD